jgi:hypothetical protein
VESQNGKGSGGRDSGAMRHEAPACISTDIQVPATVSSVSSWSLAPRVARLSFPASSVPPVRSR